MLFAFFLLFVLAISSLGSTRKNSNNEEKKEEIYKNEKYSSYDVKKINKLKNTVNEMFKHAWFNYEVHASPADELAPLSCIGVGRDWEHPMNFVSNDVRGDYALTIIDTLDMFVVLNDSKGFQRSVNQVKSYLGKDKFDIPSTVQVFEATIRMLGGLLSAHRYASDKNLGFAIKNYDGFLLDLSIDLAERLYIAFDTPTGIPMPRVNLRYGDPKDEITETCSAGASSLILEFALLSNMTGNPKYINVAKNAFFAIWNRRSGLNLIGSSIDYKTGLWLSSLTGIGAGIDSFYEYAFKYYLMTDDQDFLQVFDTIYNSYNQILFDGWIGRNVDFQFGHKITNWVDSLSAFFPGLQVIVGDIVGAIKSHLFFYKIWMLYGALPERWESKLKSYEVGLPFYPLRPEFIESTYFLYQATKDPFYLYVGEQIILDLQKRTKVSCGYAGIADVETGRFEDRMESFFTTETLKYLYLLFDPDNPINKDEEILFSTEAHIFPILSSSDFIGNKVFSANINNSEPSSFQNRLNVDIENTDKENKEKRENSEYEDEYGNEYENEIESENEYKDKALQDSTASDNYTLIYPLTCPVLSYSPFLFFFSRVTSWNEFYLLDSIYLYGPPMHTKEYMTEDEYSNLSFFDRKRLREIIAPPLTLPDAQSKAIYFTASYDIFFPGKKAEIYFFGDLIVLGSLYGVQLRVQKSHDNEYLIIKNVDGHTVRSGVSLAGDSEIPYKGIFTSLENEKLVIQGLPVLNLFFH